MMRDRFDAKLCRRPPHFQKVELAVVDLIILAAHEDARCHVSMVEPLGDGHDLLPVEHALHRAAGRQVFACVGRHPGHRGNLVAVAFAVNAVDGRKRIAT